MTVPNRPEPDCVLHPRGDLDFLTVDGVLNDWLEVIDRTGPDTVTINLAEVDFIDQSGLRMLLFLRQCLLDRGVPCLVRGASAHQQKVMDLLGIASLFPDAVRPLESPSR